VALFATTGSSIAEWRLAAMLLLPLAFVPLAVLTHVIQYAPSRLRLLTPEDIRLSRAAIVYGALAIVFGNVAVRAYAAHPRDGFDAAWRGLDEVRKLGLPGVTVRLDKETPQSEALARYYLAGSKVDFIDPEAGLAAETLANISAKQPLFVQEAGCTAAGHDDVLEISGLGCLVKAPPSVTFDKKYAFEGRFLFLAYEGLTGRKAGGRWNAREEVELRVTADPARVRLDENLNVNLLLNPFLVEGAPPRRVQVVWGNGDIAETEIGAREWISLPVREGDWAGNRLWSLPIGVRVLDRRAILFEELSVTKEPGGRAVDRHAAP
jgi:hypothetical protein